MQIVTLSLFVLFSSQKRTQFFLQRMLLQNPHQESSADAYQDKAQSVQGTHIVINSKNNVTIFFCNLSNVSCTF